MPTFLVDTNVLVYAYDGRNPAKQARALAVLTRLAENRQGALSAQVLGEFFTVATRKLTPPLSSEEAERRITNFARLWLTYDVSTTAVLEAARGTRRHQFSYWDGLIWAVAKLQGIPNVLTEDVPSAGFIEGVRFIDPFAQAFNLASLG